MATPNRKYNKCPFKDPFDKDLDPLIHKLQGTWFDSSSCRVGGTAKMRVIGTRVYSFFSFGMSWFVHAKHENTSHTHTHTPAIT